jgi:hypothetical protein
MIQQPIILILADRGEGKTLLATGLAYMYHTVDHLSIVTNYTLYNIPYRKMGFKTLLKHMDTLSDCLLILDEVHTMSDAYEFFTKSVKKLTTFVTQLRKRHITLIIITQRNNFIAKRLRQMVNYVMECSRTDVVGVVDVKVFDLSLPQSQSFVKEFVFDGRQFFDYYDTNEVITSET